MVEERMARVPAVVEKMRRDDTEFITAETVAMFADCSMPEAAVALTRLGFDAIGIGTLQLTPQNMVEPNGPLPVVLGERVFTVLDGRRWTKVPEYLSNGQLTARFFVDETTGEVRAADSWKSPKSWPLAGERAEFVLGIVRKFREQQAEREALRDDSRARLRRYAR